MKYVTAVIAALGLLMLGTASAQAEEVAESFSDPGPVDLSGSDHATGNVGERVQLGSVELTPGEWTVTASVRLFVADVDGAWKNSQGCGLYAGGEQLGGAGGSSGIWTVTGGGKEVVLDTFLVPPDWADLPIALNGPATQTLPKTGLNLALLAMAGVGLLGIGGLLALRGRCVSRCRDRGRGRTWRRR